MARKHDGLVTDKQWEKVRQFIPEIPRSRKGGRPRADDRLCFEGILWVLRSGARWRDLPDCFPSPTTCWRRLVEWDEPEVFVQMWHAFLDELSNRGRIQWDELFIDGSFAPAKKGAPTLEKRSVDEVQSGWWWRMAREYLCRVPPTRHRPRK